MMPSRILKVRLTDTGELVRGILDLPLYESPAAAGFPSPADDFLEHNLDLNKHLIRHPEATFLVKVHGDSMVGAGINSGDILIVDRSLEPADNRVIIACVDGDLFVKRIRLRAGAIYLVSDNEKYRPVEVTPDMDFEVWGVVIHVIHSL